MRRIKTIFCPVSHASDSGDANMAAERSLAATRNAASRGWIQNMHHDAKLCTFG